MEIILPMGTLFLVATPIGNLADLSARAAQVLRDADAILAEDTRISRVLLASAGVTKIPEPYHDFNKERVTPAVIARLKNGETVALITDAGTPGIADPAFNLARAAIAEGIAVIAVPGACAALAALVASGLPTDRFVFENFLPFKSGARRRVLESFVNEPRTVIFYETPHRIVKVLEAMDEVFGDVLVVIGRELTKIHEEYLRGPPRGLIERFTTKPPRGEMTVLFNTRVKAEKGRG
ncbi:MAG: 16S rRNA (cytidine(1402)-2'-O)-methyltransferase [Chitinispirillaceae bacterium]|nr:16S rRNA (cytidine(1402)-2'-O)-methyltransferase [Chitinispirillaceae bacterium]